MSRKTLLIDEYFDLWIGNHPESAHWKDTQRFYMVAWAVCRYGRGKTRNQSWLREKIEEREHYLTKDDVDYYCSLFESLQNFYKYIRGIKT